MADVAERIVFTAARREQSPIVVLLGWWGASERALSKFAKMYTDRGHAVCQFTAHAFEAFGCGVIPDGTGVFLNNRMTGFSLDPSAPNFIQPNKRTMHTLNTYMVLRDGRPFLLGGTPGGHYQVQTNFQLVSNVLDHGMNVQQAVEAPRWGHDEITGIAAVETRFPDGLADALRGRGHVIQSCGAWGNPSRAHLIAVDPENGSFTGGSDPRWHGQAIGY